MNQETIKVGFRLLDHMSIKDAMEHPRLGPALNLASSFKVVSKYDVKSIEAKFTKGNLFLAKLALPHLNNNSIIAKQEKKHGWTV